MNLLPLIKLLIHEMLIKFVFIMHETISHWCLQRAKTTQPLEKNELRIYAMSIYIGACMCTWLKTPKHWKWLMNCVNIRIKAFSIEYSQCLNCLSFSITTWVPCQKAYKIDTHCDHIACVCAPVFAPEKWSMVICLLFNIAKYLIDENYAKILVLLIRISFGSGSNPMLSCYS